MSLNYFISHYKWIVILRKILLIFGFIIIMTPISYGYTVGGINLDQTRIVYLSSDKAQTLVVNNTSDRAWLIQSRVQEGENNGKSPFIITPPLFTLQQGNRQILRIVKLNKMLPEDRESVFYLSVLAIPAAKIRETDESNKGVISVGMNFTLKMFYRPAALSQDAEKTSCHLRIIPSPAGIRIENPTPYFQTFGKFELNGNQLNLNDMNSMLAPYSSREYQIKNKKITQVQWQTINDYGGLSEVCRQNTGEGNNA